MNAVLMNKIIAIIGFGLCAILLVSSVGSADVPELIRYQGKLADSQGVPLDGDYNLTFRLYDREIEGTAIWQETQANIPVTQGLFNVLLGQVTAIDIPFDEPYWLSIQVNDDPEMSPRQQITSVAYAFRAKKAETVENLNLESIDADKLDGYEGTYYLDLANHTGALTNENLSFVNLNADLLDSQHGSHYLNLDNHYGTLSLNKGGTGTNLVGIPGGVVYSTASGLGISSSGTAGGFLRSGGSSSPTWQKVNLADPSNVTGTLPVTQGGTGLTTSTSGDILYASGTNTWTRLPKGKQGQVLIQGSDGPEWSDFETVETVDGFIRVAGLSSMSKVDINRLLFGGTDADNLFYILCLNEIQRGIHGWTQIGQTVKLYTNHNTGRKITVQFRSGQFEAIMFVKAELGSTSIESGELANGSRGETTYTYTFDFSAEDYGLNDFKFYVRNGAGGGGISFYRGVLCFWGDSASSTQSTVWQTIKYNLPAGQRYISVPCVSENFQLYENTPIEKERKEIKNDGYGYIYFGEGGLSTRIHDYKFQVKPVPWND